MARLNISFIIYLLSFLFSGCAEVDSGKRIAIAFYNCELFYDTVDNPLTDDNDFTPTGNNKYTGSIYQRKLHHMAVVLQSMKEAPAMVGLAEVENGGVLADLVQQPEMVNRGYKYILHEGEDRRGMNVGMLYDTTRFKVIGSSIAAVALPDTEKTRGVLMVHGVLKGDTLFVLVNHWPSRRGGVAESVGKRQIAAQFNKAIADGIYAEHPAARIVIMGDFNDNPNDSTMRQVLAATAHREGVPPQEFYNPFAEMYAAGQGTEVYRHEWNLFDQVIVSGSLLTGGSLRYMGAEIYKPAFLQSKHKDHIGEPYRSWLGSKWINGYSDHFPVVLYLGRN